MAPVFFPFLRWWHLVTEVPSSEPGHCDIRWPIRILAAIRPLLFVKYSFSLLGGHTYLKQLQNGMSDFDVEGVTISAQNRKILKNMTLGADQVPAWKAERWWWRTDRRQLRTGTSVPRTWDLQNTSRDLQNDALATIPSSALKPRTILFARTALTGVVANSPVRRCCFWDDSENECAIATNYLLHFLR